MAAFPDEYNGFGPNEEEAAIITSLRVKLSDLRATNPVPAGVEKHEFSDMTILR